MVLAERLLALMFISTAEVTGVPFGYIFVFVKFGRRYQEER